MADENGPIPEWNNDKNDEIIFSLLGDFLQNKTNPNELYTLLSSQANSKSHFQSDNEYRCKEDVVDEDEDSDLNKLVDILKYRLQNGKSVPAGLTQDKLARLKDDFMRQREENKRVEQNHQTPTKKSKSATSVPVAKPKPKSKKQLQAEQRRREIEMANIAKELEEKKKREEAKEQVRKKQERERQRLLEEEMKKQEEDKRKQLNETRRKKEKDEKEREQRSQKEKERQEKLRKIQEEELRKKEEEKRRKAEEKAAKQKASKEMKEREEKERFEKQQQEHQLQQKSQAKARSQQYQQYQQQQQKYPREVPPRFLRQQQMKLNISSSRRDDYSFNTNNSSSSTNNNSNTTATDTSTYVRESSSSWNEPNYDSSNNRYFENSTEDWDVDTSDNNNSVNNNQLNVESSWGGKPVSEDWDVGINQPQTRSSVLNVDNRKSSTEQKHQTVNESISVATKSAVSKSLFGPNDPPLPSLNNSNNDNSWGASLTGSSWDIPNTSIKQWDIVPQSLSTVNTTTPTNNDSNLSLNNSSTVENSSSPKPILNKIIPNSNIQVNKVTKSINDCLKSGSPGITSWAGLDSFDALPSSSHVDTLNNSQNGGGGGGGGTKPKVLTLDSFNNSDNNSDTMKLQGSHHNSSENNTVLKTDIETDKSLNTLNSKVDSNLKVTGWLQNSTTNEIDWVDDEKQSNDDEFGWTKVSIKTKKPTVSSATNSTSVNNVPIPSAPTSTPVKAESNTNAWTNRALKQLLDMGFKREHAEKALRDNNGIIESAVSDLLTKGDYTTGPKDITTDEKGISKQDIGGTPTGTPQKLNRKQRRKLQQMQNAEQAKTQITPSPQKIEPPQTTTPLSDIKTITGDGLLPTPPASQRLVPTTEIGLPPSSPENVLNNRPPLALSQENAISKPVTRSLASQPSLPPSTPTKSEISNPTTSSAPAPIGSARPSSQLPIQPPTPIQPPKQSQTISSRDTAETPTNSTPLQPPMHPVLLAQMHLQQLGIQDITPSTSSFSAVQSSNNVTSQTVTNTMIQQYLQQIAQTSEIDSSQNMPSSSINSQGLMSASSMHLTGLLQQAPIPAASLSDGPQKSKLLQWTQPNSASNSEPTTPPSSEEEKDKNNPLQKVDPVSAKWGVVAAPRLSPTPAEFKPGVPWKPRGEPDGKSDDVDDNGKEDENVIARALEMQVNNPLAHMLPLVATSPTKSMITPSPMQYSSSDMNTISHPGLNQPMFSSVQQINSVEQSLNSLNDSQPKLSNDNPLQMKGPPGLNGVPVNPSFKFPTGTKGRDEDMNWLILRRISSAVDPSTIRTLCEQFGNLLHIRVIANAVYVRYETVQQAHSAFVSLNGQKIFNTRIIAEISTESECLKAMELSAVSMHNVTPPLPITNQVNPLGFNNIPTYGGLWATSNANAPPQPTPPPQHFLPQSFSSNQQTAPFASNHQSFANNIQSFGNNPQSFSSNLYGPPTTAGYGPPTSAGVNGFNHWAIPNNQPVITNGNQLWGPAPPTQPPQASNLYQPYPGWVHTKQEIPLQPSMFSPAIDRCELFNGTKDSNS